MATIDVWEHELAREFEIGKNGKAETTWGVSGTNNEDVALALVYEAAWGVTLNFYFLQSMHATQTGPQLWEVRVTYGPESQPDDKSQDSTDPNDGNWKLSWDMTGGTTHITQSLQTVSKGGNNNFNLGGASIPDFKGAIGVSEGGVAGCEIHTPQLQWHETRQVPRLIGCSYTYLRALYKLVGRTNQATFRGCDIGECLFFGARGDISSKDPRFMEITYNFAASPNVQQILIGSCDPVDKKGWEYLWVLYHESVDVNAKFKIKVPAAVYVEQVYKPGDFSVLKIGN